ncbi:MAG: hypothetical protein ACFCVF_00455 [Kineosporiaceae bacterium]
MTRQDRDAPGGSDPQPTDARLAFVTDGGQTTLAGLLEPFRWRANDVGDWDADLDDLGWRFTDVPPGVMTQALDLVDEWMSTYRPNAQPPARWLVARADEHRGLLAGLVVPGRERLRVDGVQVPRAAARRLAVQVAECWPAADGWPPALELALAEVWPSWDAERSTWEEMGTKLLDELPPGEVVGLWWD